MKKSLFTLALMLMPLVSFGENTMRIRCTAWNPQDCEGKVIAELQKQQCGLDESSLRCKGESDGVYCSANVQSCFDAHSDGFTGKKCGGGATMKKFSDHDLTATWAISFLWLWVREFCQQQ